MCLEDLEQFRMAGGIIAKGGIALGKNLELSYLLDFYGDVLTEKQHDVMQQYYNDDLSLAEIAENFGITRQGVRDSIKRGELILLELEEKVGFAAKYKAIQAGLASLEEIVKDVEFRNNSSFSKNDDLAKSVDEMLEIISSLAEN